MRFGPVCPQTGDRSASFPRYAVTSAPRAITVKSGRCHVCMVIHSFARPHPENSTSLSFHCTELPLEGKSKLAKGKSGPRLGLIHAPRSERMLRCPFIGTPAVRRSDEQWNHRQGSES